MAAVTVIVLLIIYAIKAVIMIIPVPALYMAAGVAFPTWWAIIVTYLGLLISFSIGYFNGKKLGEKKVSEMLSKNKKVAGFFESKHLDLPSMCFISRLIPLPKDLLSMFYGAVGMPFQKYIVISLLGVSPVMIPYVVAGAYAADPLSLEFLLPFGVNLSIILTSFAIYKKIQKRPASKS